MKALVVGYGRMGAFHARTLRDLGYTVTTVDPNPERLADHETLGSVGPRSFDVAAVAVPPGELLATAYQLAGLPMLVEKPFALNVREARMLAAYLAQQGSKVCVGLVERFNPQVRALRALLMDGTVHGVTDVTFTRHNDRPTFDLDLDLRLHDIDLTRFLAFGCPVEYDTRARCERKIRTITVTHAEGVLTVDLMDHALSPLHALWHAFLTGRPHPTPADAIWALQDLQAARRPNLALAA